MDSIEKSKSSGMESENDSSTYEDSSSDSITSSEENIEEDFLNIKKNIKIKENILQTPWVLWFHKTKDVDWSAKSFIQLYEINTIEDFWRLYSNWEECLPNIETNMYFLMRKGVLPMWEDKSNIQGGSWSVKISRNNVLVLDRIVMALIGEAITQNNDLSK